MATICDKISADLLNNCDIKPVSGVDETITLINQDDISAVTYDATNPQVVRGITLKAGSEAYKFEVYKNTHKPRTTSVNRPYGTYQKHEIATAMMTWDIATKIQAQSLFGSKVIAIVENLQKTGDARVEIYGWDQGLTIAEGAVRDTAANDGVFNFTLSSEDEYPEPHLPKTFAVEVASAYSYVATISAVNALLIPASSNSNLSVLTVSQGTLTPVFVSSTTNYTVAVATGIASMTVTPTIASGGSTVTVNGFAVASGSPSQSIPLTIGSNTITIVVTATDGQTKTYTIVVTRAAV